MWRKGNSLALLIEYKLMEGSMESLLKTGNKTTI